ncbi:helix-turn-helix domain-containing protein [Cupriavidus sp. KB_39]|uniref:helix-turn-helix domain-containing protein n=1 Tax=Cupriavidus sp. KB_39 TaxID=3233036 RepID=UPI003F911E18
MKLDSYLNALIAKQGLKNDRALADYLGVGNNTISQWRNGVRSPDNEMCLRLAIELNEDPMRIMMAAGMDRAERTGQRSLWEVFSKRMHGHAAPASLAVLAALVGGSVTKFVTSPALQASTDAILWVKDCVLC